MKSERELASILDREKTELINHIHGEYWNNTFKALFKNYTYQYGYFMVPVNLSVGDVSDYCRRNFSELCKKYGISVTETNGPSRTEFILRIFFDRKKKTKADELSIVICNKDITLRIFPYDPLLKQFMLEEYVLVTNIIVKLFDVIFNSEKEKFEALATETKHIEECSKKINSKSIEIARSSIRALYFQNDKSDHASFVQKALYSSFLKNGKVVRIYHKDFFENPEVLTNLFENNFKPITK
ncbi:hypothetical protein [Treponema bryantii]|uniref:hypothetical protein n=1 Tax=Treponema bryantii TaxID=163 RepID=UPI0003B75FD6|nr:hypothetical protein [Treponema bryantii]